MTDPSFDLDAAHRWFAVETNNRCWDLIELPARSPEETAEMLHTAHASCWHWDQVGDALHHQRARCLLATACATAGDGAGADRAARACIELSERNGDRQSDFDRSTAYACAAQAASINGDDAAAQRYADIAADAAAQLGASERQAFEDLYDLPPRAP